MFCPPKENFAISIGIYHDGKPYAGFVYDVMKDVLYHAKVGQGAFENTHKLEMIQNTELKRSIIGINPNWLSKPILSDIFSSIVNEARSARAYGSIRNYKCSEGSIGGLPNTQTTNRGILQVDC